MRSIGINDPNKYIIFTPGAISPNQVKEAKKTDETQKGGLLKSINTHLSAVKDFFCDKVGLSNIKQSEEKEIKKAVEKLSSDASSSVKQEKETHREETIKKTDRESYGFMPKPEDTSGQKDSSHERGCITGISAEITPKDAEALSPSNKETVGHISGSTISQAPGTSDTIENTSVCKEKSTDEITSEISEYILSLPCITEGLNESYSPNHTQGMTTTEHINNQVKTLRDYDALHAMINNPNAPEHLQVSVEDLKAFLEPLFATLGPSDWKVLTVVAGFHDLGKMNPQWAEKSGLNMKGVEWIAHDFDSETILTGNPELLSRLNLTDKEKEKVLLLARLHSLPGQYFFGEGNVSAYKPLFDMAREEKSEGVLSLARIHGLLDVMSAVNGKFSKPILNSHNALRQFISEAYRDGTPPGEKFKEASIKELGKEGTPDEPSLKDVATRFNLGPVAMNRLKKLVGNARPADFISAFEAMDPAFIKSFNSATDGEKTWFGTYIANSFGSGLLKALKGPIAEGKASTADVIQATVKTVACAYVHRTRQEATEPCRTEWALGAQEPSLFILKGEKQALALLNETKKLTSPEAGASLLASSREGLTLRSGQSGIVFGYTE